MKTRTWHTDDGSFVLKSSTVIGRRLRGRGGLPRVFTRSDFSWRFTLRWCCSGFSMFVPVEAIPTHAGTLFLQAALLDWPEVLVSGAIILVSFVLPIFNRGLSWGQRMADIEVLYTEETRMGGFYLSLALRTCRCDRGEPDAGLDAAVAGLVARVVLRGLGNRRGDDRGRCFWVGCFVDLHLHPR